MLEAEKLEARKDGLVVCRQQRKRRPRDEGQAKKPNPAIREQCTKHRALFPVTWNAVCWPL